MLAAIMLPFVAGDPTGFWRGVVRFQFLQPFRADSLSSSSFWVRQTGSALPPLPLLGLGLGVLVLVLLAPAAGHRPGLRRAAAAPAAVLIWNKQAFCNYWWLCSGLLGAAAAASGDRETA